MMILKGLVLILFCFFNIIAYAELPHPDKKVSVKEVQFDSAVADITWAGSDNKSVFFGIVEFGLFVGESSWELC